MHHDAHAIDPLRLIDAADAVGQALAEVADASTGRCPYPPALLDSPDCPECLRGFSTEEVEEATRFLCRMGFLAQVSGSDVR